MATNPRRHRARRRDSDRNRKAMAQVERRDAGRPRLESIDAALVAGLRVALTRGGTTTYDEERGEWRTVALLRSSDILQVAYEHLRRSHRLTWATPEGVKAAILERLGVHTPPHRPVQREHGE